MTVLLVLLLIFLPLILCEAEMLESRSVRHFPECGDASQVRVRCQEKNDTVLIRVAQYCAPDHQSCRNMSKSGVSLEKTGDGVTLTVTTSVYCSWSCKADCYIDDDKRQFTINVCNQTASTLATPEPTTALPRTDHLTSQESTKTSPDPGKNEPHPEAGITLQIFLMVLTALTALMELITFLILYKKETPENECQNKWELEKFLKSESVV